MPISNPGAAKTIVSGSFTGDGTNNRQITTGFQCSMAVIMGPLAANRGIMIPNAGSSLDDGVPFASGSQLHATDGFIVSAAGPDLLNVTSDTYYYWAISE